MVRMSMKKLIFFLVFCMLGTVMVFQNVMADINESFEGSFPPAGWQLYTTGGGWQQTTNRFHTGSYSAYHNDFYGDQDGWLITPLLSVTNGDHISFWQSGNWDSYYTYHGLWVCTSGCGSPPTNWVELVALGAAIEDSWEQKIVDLSTYAGQDIYLAFHYQGDFSDEWYVDDVVFPSTYPVTYDGNGNTGGAVPVDASSPYVAGATVTVLGNTGSLVRDGFTFNGWNTAADGSDDSYAAGDTFTMPAADVTLYAQWTAVSPAAIPTLSEWGMIIFALLMAGIAVVCMRRQRNMTA